jgi:putative ABC transport system permease protein
LAKQIHDLYKTYEVLYKNDGGNTHIPEFQALVAKSSELINLISNTFGNSAYVQLTNSVIDKLGNQQIYNGLSNTVNSIEVVTLTCITLLVSLIVILISSMLITNSERLGSILKALGYSDRSILESFLSIYVPTIFMGLAIAIPITFLLVFGFTNIIFGVGGILLLNSIK